MPISGRCHLADGGRWRAAVVGAGPSGFYTTDQLLAAGFEVDLFDSLPTPFGLVRAGVTPAVAVQDGGRSYTYFSCAL